MRILIIEDEKPAARRLARIVSSLGYKDVEMIHSVKEALDWFNKNAQPDLILLDIQLSDGLSFEIFDEIDINSPIIFTTAYDEYALKAFKLNSIDYLLKPIDEDELAVAIEKLNNRQSSSNNIQSLDIDQIKRLLSNPNEKVYKDRFTVKIGQHLKMITTKDIVCFYSENKGVYIHTVDDRGYLVDLTLEQVEDKIDPNLFFRINRKYLINMNFIEDMISYTNSRLQLVLKNFKADDVIVSRDKVKSFKGWLE